MANNRMTEGVGKKIVEALKMQSDIEVATSEDSFETQEFTEKIPEEIENYAEETIPTFEDTTFESEPEISEENQDSKEV